MSFDIILDFGIWILRMNLNSVKIKQFQSKIWKHYEDFKRDLPWRHTADPYKIFISEVMLQQTQVSRVIPKYDAFLKKFPTFSRLAQSELVHVLQQWSGLGYNRRGRFLWESAQIIIDTYKGIVPNDPELVDLLPGIGRATASSIIVFSYNIPLVFIETNIRRVFINAFFNQKSEIRDADIEKLVAATLDKENPREWYYALMDYGAFLGKTIENPNKKSAHYTKQSKFKGSTRQLRGFILKQLVFQKRISVMELQMLIGPSPHIIEEVIAKLVSDKLIRVSGEYLSIR